MAVSYEELAGSGARSGGKITRYLKVAWDDCDAIEEELLGFLYMAGDKPIYSAPAAYPGKPEYFCVQCDIEPFMPENISSRGGGPYYVDGAKVTAVYSPLAVEVGPDDRKDNDTQLPPWVSVQLDIGGEMMTLPNDSLTWSLADSDGSKKVAKDASAGMLVPTSTLKMHWENVPELPLNQLRELRGKINNEEFFGAEPGTVLFTGISAKRDWKPGQQQHFWSLDLTFEEKKVEATGLDGLGGRVLGWNYFRRDRASSSGLWWDRLQADGEDVYAEGDLNELFKIPQGSNNPR